MEEREAQNATGPERANQTQHPSQDIARTPYGEILIANNDISRTQKPTTNQYSDHYGHITRRATYYNSRKQPWWWPTTSAKDCNLPNWLSISNRLEDVPFDKMDHFHLCRPDLWWRRRGWSLLQPPEIRLHWESLRLRTFRDKASLWQDQLFRCVKLFQ